MKNLKNKFFITSMPIILGMCSLFLISDNAAAASRASVRGTPVATTTRKPVSKAVAKATTEAVAETVAETVEETTSDTTTGQQTETVSTPALTVNASDIKTDEPKVVEEPEPEAIIVNKSNQFDELLSFGTELGFGSETNDFVAEIRKQREALEAREAATLAANTQKKAMATGLNTCDSDLRKCMQETCGKDFTKCTLDGDTVFGEKLNKCRRDTTCSGEEFKLFTIEIKADRDLNAKLSSYNDVVDCGNAYNACIVSECGATYSKCLGKDIADRAVKKCETVAKQCTEQDSGLAARFGTVIGKLRGMAETEIKSDEERMYALRDLMRSRCEHLGANFDERSFDCVYTVNFFAGENQSSPTASRKRYAGDTFICMQEWFGINATTYKENAYRETRSQTSASSAMLGSGLGVGVGAITSGAIDRAIDTQKAKKEYKKAEKEVKNIEKEQDCEARGGVRKASSCWCGAVVMVKNSVCDNGKIKYGKPEKIACDQAIAERKAVLMETYSGCLDCDAAKIWEQAHNKRLDEAEQKMAETCNKK